MSNFSWFQYKQQLCITAGDKILAVCQVAASDVVGDRQQVV